ARRQREMCIRDSYFREPGGVLFEIATDTPGFTYDESFEHLGTSLHLPAWLEPVRTQIMQKLPPIPYAAPLPVQTPEQVSVSAAREGQEDGQDSSNTLADGA
ncbi:MAG: hypothetical protein N2318_12425, partial [Meiothermus sp.]|nr:hypothetical protein [Meiothermus sp.]